MGVFDASFWTGRDPYQNPYAAQEKELGGALWQQAQGLGTSPAQLQMQMGLEAAQRQAASTAAGARGMNPGMAMKLATGQQAELGQGAIGQAAILRAQEQQRAQQLYAQYLQGLHGMSLQEYSQGGGDGGFFGNLMGAGLGAGAAYLGSGGWGSKDDKNGNKAPQWQDYDFAY